MSSAILKDDIAPVLLFRSVNGSRIRLNDKSRSSIDATTKNVIKFVLSKDKSLNISASLFLLFTTLFLWKTFDTLVPFAVSTIVLILKLSSFITAVDKDTLIAIESVGIYIQGKRVFCGLNSCEFLPWDTLEDVFINEVITGVTKSIVLSYNHSKRIHFWERFNKIGSFVQRINTREKMPGIHVRTAGQFDWTQQREGPVLTVPGSYWLCYKKHIYKFIFRYHRTIRNTKEFNFGRELMKVIRRIIKCQPRQGQQFGTRHLLVTYNHTSWTRQDKMFAMLKFQGRSDAAAFSHAFVLTIKVSCPLVSMESKTEYSVTSPQSNQPVLQADDSDDTYEYETESNEKSDKFLTYPSENDLPQKDVRCESETNEQVLQSENNNTQLDSILEVTNVGKVLADKEMPLAQAENSANESSSNSSSDASCEQPVLTYNTPTTNIMKHGSTTTESKRFRPNILRRNRNEKHNVCNETSTLLNDKANKVKKVQDTVNRLKHLNSPNIKNTEQKSSPNETKREDIELSNKVDELSQLDKYDTEEVSTDNSNSRTSSVNTSSDNSSMTDETNTDSASLPYQYLIEKEIENAKIKTPNPENTLKKAKDKDKHNNFVDEQNPKKRKLSDVNEESERHSTPYSKKRKYVPESKTSRSSDITDLVMEGLMFTIRQDQDSVAVIEQKTKLEVDEVLENSEKAETKEGEKCLRNSSLLGLENLITMIEMPKRTENKQKSNDMMNQENSLQFKPFTSTPLFNSTKYNYTNSTKVDEQRNSGIFQWKSFCSNSLLASTSSVNDSEKLDTMNIQKRLETDDSQEHATDETFTEDEEKEEEEEEDIVPEALQDEIFQPLARDLLMDDIDFKEPEKHETTKLECATSVKKHSVTNSRVEGGHSNNVSLVRSNNLHTKSATGFNNTGKRESSGPRVVSYQIITVDQMPLALQKALRDKLAKKPLSLNDTNKNLKNNTAVPEAQSSEKIDTTTNAQSKIQNMHSSTSENTQCVAETQAPAHSDNLIHNESTASTSGKELHDSSATENNAKLKRKDSEVQKINVNKSKQPAPSKLQDITQNFYKDLSQLQKKNNSTDQRCLRQRKKSVHTANNIKDSESRVEMLKFIHDITRGAKVVIRRMSTQSIHSILGKSSSLATCMH